MNRLLLHGGTVFDGAESRVADVVVEGDRIVGVGVGLDGDEGVDCTGRTILPGLIDSHVHLMLDGLNPRSWLGDPFSLQFFTAVRTMRATLDIGVTSVRDAGGADLGVKEAQRRGVVPGPRTQISISLLSQTGGHGDPWQASGCVTPIFQPHPGRPGGIADGPDEVRRKVRELLRAGADVIKIASSGGVVSPRDDPRHGHFRGDEVDVVVAEATAAGAFVMSHAIGADGIKTAVRSGVRSIEHGIFLDDEAVELMLARGTWLVPTLLAPRGVLEASAALDPYVVEKAHLVVAHHQASVTRALDAGVPIAFGTDTGVTEHGRNLEELVLLTGCGMTPAQALRAATSSAAELLGVGDVLGSVEPGKLADLVVVDGDPCEPAVLGDLKARIRRVYQGGVVVSGV